MSILFPGSTDIAGTVDRLRALADDLERMTMFLPTERELQDAPIIDTWSLSRRGVLALSGSVRNHPELGSTTAQTSEVYAIDGKARWARTMSRFYILGDTVPHSRRSHNASS